MKTFELDSWMCRQTRRLEKMESFPHAFRMLELCGVWRPVDWPPGMKTKLYGFYSCYVVFILITLLVSLSVELFIQLRSPVKDVDAIANGSFFMMTVIADCGKAVNIYIKRAEIIELTNSLRKEPCKPETNRETDIQRKYDEMVRFNTLRFMGVVYFTIFSALLAMIQHNIPVKTLPYYAWLPYDYQTSYWIYSIAYSHQISGVLYGATISIAFDTLLPGLMLQTCSQLKILSERFQRMPEILQRTKSSVTNELQPLVPSVHEETSLLSKRVKHHIAIFKFAEKANGLFGIMIFVQYSVSVYVLCICLLRLSKEALFSPTFTEMLIYLCEMGVQILLYCYHGGEITTESLKLCDSIYEIDWTALSCTTKRSLVMIMARTLRPIQFTTASIITLDLESFKSLVKLSYSAYNVL